MLKFLNRRLRDYITSAQTHTQLKYAMRRSTRLRFFRIISANVDAQNKKVCLIKMLDPTVARY